MLKIEKLDIPEITAADVRDEWIYYQSDASDHRYQMAEDEDFHLGNQLTQDQKNYLIAVGQPPEANNKIRPAVEQVLANVASSSPEWEANPVGKTDHEVAFVFSQLMADIWDKSDGDVQYRRNCKDFIVKGLTYEFVYPDWHAEGGLGAVRMRRLPPEAVFVDPNSALPDFDDASSIIYSDLHTKVSLKIAIPQYADKIEEADEDFDKNEISSGKYSSDSVTTAGDITDNRQPMVRKFVRLAKVSVPMARITE